MFVPQKTGTMLLLLYTHYLCRGARSLLVYMINLKLWIAKKYVVELYATDCCDLGTKEIVARRLSL